MTDGTSQYAPVSRQYSTTSGLYFIAAGKEFYASQYGSGRLAEQAANDYLASQGKTGVPFGTAVGPKPPDMSQEYRYHDPGDIHYYMPGGEGYQAGKAPTLVSQPTAQAIAERPAAAITPGSEVAGIKAQVGQITAPTSHPMIPAAPSPKLTLPATPQATTEGFMQAVAEGRPVISRTPPPQTELLTEPLYKKAQEITGITSQYAEKIFPTPSNIFTPQGAAAISGQTVIKAIGSLPETIAIIPRGYEEIVRDIGAGKVQQVPSRIITGAGLMAAGTVEAVKERPFETIGTIAIQTALLGGISKGLARVKAPEIPSPKVTEGMFGVEYVQGKPPSSFPLGKYEGESGFQGTLMSYKEAKVAVPETTPTVPKSEEVGLMSYKEAKPAVPEIYTSMVPKEAVGGAGRAKSLADITEVNKLMSYEKAVPRTPEIFQPIKPIETAGGVGRAKSILGLEEVPKPKPAIEIIDLSKAEPLKSSIYSEGEVKKEPTLPTKLSEAPKTVTIKELEEGKPPEGYTEIKTKTGQVLLQKTKLEELQKVKVIDMTKAEELRTPILALAIQQEQQKIRQGEREREATLSKEVAALKPRTAGISKANIQTIEKAKPVIATKPAAVVVLTPAALTRQKAEAIPKMAPAVTPKQTPQLTPKLAPQLTPRAEAKQTPKLKPIQETQLKPPKPKKPKGIPKPEYPAKSARGVKGFYGFTETARIATPSEVLGVSGRGKGRKSSKTNVIRKIGGY